MDRGKEKGNNSNQQALKNLLTESYLEDEHKNLQNQGQGISDKSRNLTLFI
jgi:hypothetical protein